MSLRKYIDLVESMENKTVPVLYHGTCEENALSIVKNGWQPKSGTRGANMGQTRFLYLSTGYEDALWFANEKGCNTVLRVKNVPYDFLIVDPEDGIRHTVEDELNCPSKSGYPGKVALTKTLSANHFEIMPKEFKPL